MNKEQRTEWLGTCEAISKALGLRKGDKPPFNLLQFVHSQRRQTLKNPAAQLFSGKKITLYDDEGNPKVKFSWGDDAVEKAEVAIDEGYWRVVERVLYATCPIFDMSARSWLNLQTLGELASKGEIPPLMLPDGKQLSKRTFNTYIKPLVRLAPIRLEAMAGNLQTQEEEREGKDKDKEPAIIEVL